jgi:hypothetical protein
MGNKRLDIDFTRLRHLAASGLSIKNIANTLGVSDKTLISRLHEDDAILEEYNLGRAQSRAATSGVGNGEGATLTELQLVASTTNKDELHYVKREPKYAIRHFIRQHPGANISDIKRGLKLNEDIISDHLATLSQVEGVIKPMRREGEELARFYPIKRKGVGTSVSLAA